MSESVENTEVDIDQLHSRSPEPASPAAQIRKALRGKHVCPFCGTTRETEVGPCQQCSLEDGSSTRAATRSKLGPWYVLQSRNPSAPGMNYSTLLTLVQKGRVTARSVIRGPTTGQFWKHAAKVKGVSREFGLCWNCGGDVPRTARVCPSCKRLQEPPVNPDVLLEIGESTEDLAEQMWAQDPPAAGESDRPRRRESEFSDSPMDRDVLGDRCGPIDHSSPIAEESPVDRLTARGGVRREIPAPASRPRRNGGIIADADEELHVPTSLEMAVFQGSFTNPRHPAVRRGGFVRGFFKMVLVALITSGVGLAAWCHFDPAVAQRVQDYWKQALAWIEQLKGSDGAANAGPSARQGKSPATSRADSGLSREAAKLKMWDLWEAGEQASRAHDYARAVKALEEINALPLEEGDKPLGFNGTLEQARKKLAGK